MKPELKEQIYQEIKKQINSKTIISASEIGNISDVINTGNTAFYTFGSYEWWDRLYACYGSHADFADVVNEAIIEILENNCYIPYSNGYALVSKEDEQKFNDFVKLMNNSLESGKTDDKSAVFAANSFAKTLINK